MKKIETFLNRSILAVLMATAFMYSFQNSVGQSPVQNNEEKKNIELYVDPHAAGSMTGSEQFPFRNLKQARDQVRKNLENGVLQDIVIYLREGTHRLKAPLQLDTRDGGNKGQTITYRAYPLERAVISGGNPVTGWEERSDGTWVTHLPSVERGQWYFRQLFVNGERRFRAQTPNRGEGYYFIDELVRPDERTALINRKAFRFKPGDIRADWKNLQDVEILKFFGWDETRLTISRVDQENTTVHFHKASSRLDGRPLTWWGNRYVVENHLEGLDAPGEWYLDRNTGILHYMPKKGETIENTRFMAPVTDRLVELRGDDENKTYIKNLTFENLIFMYSGAAFPKNGYSQVQSDVFVPGAFHAEGASNITLKNNRFAHLGTYAIRMGKGCSHNLITANRIHDIGAGGIIIGETSDPENQYEQTHNNTISDNYLYDMGHIYLAGAGILIGRSHHNRVAHNEIYDILGNAISVGWKWDNVLTDAHHNIIEYNQIHHIGNRKMGGGSGIYTLSRQPGTVIRFNLIHDLRRYHDEHWTADNRTAHPCFGLQLDKGSSEIIFENNIIYNVTDNIYKQRGAENVVRNNIFAFSGDYLVVRRKQNQGALFFSHNIVLSDNGKMVGDSWDVKNFEMDYNLYWNISGNTPDFNGKTFRKWQENNHDHHSLFQDPLFTDPGQGDFTLKPGSPAFRIGFVPIDISQAGPRL